MNLPGFAKIRGLIREYGAALAALYGIHRLLQKLSGGRSAIVPYALVVQPIGSGNFGNLRDDTATVVTQVAPGDAVAADFPRPAAIVASRFASGAECYTALHNGGFAGHIWLARGCYVEDEVRCVYLLDSTTSSIWDFDVYVAPKYRLGRTMARMWKAVDAQLSQQGIRWSFSRISLFNAASARSHARLGARRCGWAVFVVLGAWQLCCSSNRPYVRLTGPSGRPPSIRLPDPN